MSGPSARAAGAAAKEADVDERSRVLMATFLGAAIGGIWGWLYMTEGGRRVRDQIEPRLDDFMNEVARVRGTVEKARTAANEGWRSLSDMTGSAQGRWSA
jgi:sigma54-dependent transcription regulator